eukprot:Phypoly_transcript_08864.p1 GENE.Phypoly_transcript_08864~~Phypoly_transcript_08864.p1  ORF type:complete len:390 (+),score=75.83 Phypoly_transcript_08864:152-1321(+)
MENSKKFPVTIIGGGPGGLTLARILQVRGFDVAVYERENSSNARGQGGTLDLHAESGQEALKEAGLIEQFRAHARPEGQDMRILDKTGKVHLDDVSQDDNNSRPEIDRRVLRSILLDSLKPDTVKWGHNLLSITAQDSGTYKISFENGQTTSSQLVVGADGAWSRVRPLLTPAKPIYSGISFVEVNISQVSQRHPTISKLVGRGTLCALSDCKGMIAQRTGGDCVRVYVALQVPERWSTESGINFSDPAQARASMLALFPDWDDSLKELLIKCDDSFLPRPIMALPTDTSWESRDGVTIIGDAAHLMSPFAGEGVNLAMQDALELANAITNCNGDINAAVKNYEKAMFPRVAEKAEESAGNLKLFFTNNAPKEFLEKMAELMAGGPPPQ